LIHDCRRRGLRRQRRKRNDTPREHRGKRCDTNGIAHRCATRARDAQKRERERRKQSALPDEIQQRPRQRLHHRLLYQIGKTRHLRFSR
jgi:hypothetical protein